VSSRDSDPLLSEEAAARLTFLLSDFGLPRVRASCIRTHRPCHRLDVDPRHHPHFFLSFFPTPPEAKMGASSQRMAGEAVESVAFSGTFGPRSSGGSHNLTPHSAVSESPPTAAAPAERLRRITAPLVRTGGDTS
jgi:hypothetical protein